MQPHPLSSMCLPGTVQAAQLPFAMSSLPLVALNEWTGSPCRRVLPHLAAVWRTLCRNRNALVHLLLCLSAVTLLLGAFCVITTGNSIQGLSTYAGGARCHREMRLEFAAPALKPVQDRKRHDAAASHVCQPAGLLAAGPLCCAPSSLHLTAPDCWAMLLLQGLCKPRSWPGWPPTTTTA